MVFDDKGYVIRCVDSFTGSVIYRGCHQKRSFEKDALMPNETYTISGAKKALANRQRMFPDSWFYSIERLSCYYVDFDTSRKVPNRQNVIYEKISHAMAQLDELWDKNNFDRGDKMRINKVRADLREIKTILLSSSIDSGVSTL